MILVFHSNRGERMVKGQMRCGQCGSRIVFEMARVGEPDECGNCGNLFRYTDQTTATQPATQPVYVMAPLRDARPKIRSSHVGPVIVALAGFLICGLGQLLIGQIGKGLLAFFCVFFLGAVLFTLMGPEGGIVSAIAAVGIQLAMMIDATLNAKKLREGTPIGAWESGFTSAQ